MERTTRNLLIWLVLSCLGCLAVIFLHTPPPQQSAIRTKFLAEMNCVVSVGTYLVDHAAEYELVNVITHKRSLPVALKDLPSQSDEHLFIGFNTAENARVVYGENEMFIAIAGPDGRIGVPEDQRVYNPFKDMLWKRGDVYVRLTVKDGKVSLQNPYPSERDLYKSLDEQFTNRLIKRLGG